jgi:tryptophanyl-tRNA synthetase
MKRVLTGDRPTGKLHIGHYVGSIKNRVQMQEQFDCHFIIADLHVLTTKKTKQDILNIRENVQDVVLDYLACGIEPEKSLIYIQSAVPEVTELTLYFNMLTSINRLTGLPSIKEMARNAHMDEASIPYGLIGYPVLQSADILLSKADAVPVGKDNVAHIEITRDIARKFNQLYGEVFPLPEALIGEVPTLIGTDGKGKMSKSAGNAILLSDDQKALEKKVRKMYTDPNRIRADIPGRVEGNPVFAYLDAFSTKESDIQALKERYQEGTVSDVEVKDFLYQELKAFLDPISQKRAALQKEKGFVERVLYEGSMKMREVAQTTLKEVKSAMGLSGLWNKISRIARKNA